MDALVQMSFLVQGVLARAGAEEGLSLIQVRLLGILRDRTCQSLELARYVGLDKSSMTGLVTRAQQRGLVRRTPSPHDGRAVLVSLTPLGREVTDRCGAEIARRIDGLTEGLTAAEHALIRTVARKLLPGTPPAHDPR
ncbi:MarR family transcriptional regulator [Streptomyces sp. RG38]|uniref:MarR family transcriptional regulator n=2 Tax=Streptomyces tagetis TaxID=2820809 RepID=A0A941B5L7_9ACTN|nr:MarR family transcriptional regulator [Streptomyces sp. RG38]